jgi:ABC-2 type transport system ATP-binding protein
MVAGFLPPTSGRVTVGGFDVVEDSLEARGQLGYMPESMPLYPEMRVEEYLAFRAELKGVRRDRKGAVKTAMEKADVADVARRLIGELSKGYRQRVGIADALVAEPALLILDEPTAGLDPNQIVHVRELIKSLGKSHTIFLSTHILSEIEAVCSRVVIIARGRIAAEGTSDEIRARMAGNARAATLVVRGGDDAVRAALAKVDGVKIVGEPARLEAAEGASAESAREVFRYALELADENGSGTERAERIAEACVAAKLGVRGLDVHGKSLEAIFHELTTSDEKPAEEKSSEAAA